ncbi:M28 family peptidase [Pontibacter sp. 172403-2]|uniref:M28 family metallopeptidase n=1 Tax=Pontibacter rufus TaxID=2791028 RepID=UPI0018AFB75B|nr:M28 family peptidase [Pontibacter sp. 172403-2]MBF9253531.1 M28 family peptidase [Pontibacter sp. 172403-2]
MKRLYILFWLLFCCGLASAQNMPRVRQTIDTLTSETMHGRGYVFEGDTKAANYIRDRFAAAGLAPLPPSNSYFQTFTLPVNRITETPLLKVDGRTLKPGKEFVVQAASPTSIGKAKMLRLDTLIFSDAATARKFFSGDLTKYALVYRQQEAKRLRELPEAYQQKLQQAKVHIVLQKGLLTTVAQQQSNIPVLEVLESSWPVGAQKVRYSIQAEFVPAYSTQNVLGFVEGSIHPDSFLVFSAHYDHLGGQGKGVYFPGANDNASGTAMLLELAAYYGQPEHRPRYSIAFMAFAAEEASLVGSRYYVQHPVFPLSQIRFLVNLDLLGTGSEGMMVVNGKIHAPEFDLLQRINGRGRYLPQIKSRGKAANSDHYYFSEAGVPAFFFYTLGGTAAYHNVNDYARQLPLTKFPEIFELLTDFAAALQE